jgi:PAS domain S-box-containing protein
VFMPIRVGDNFWSIVVATPEDEVTSTLSGFQGRIVLIAIFFVIGIGFFLYMVIKTGIVIKEVERRRKVEEELRKSEKRFRELAELLPEAVFETNIQGTLTFANKNAFDRFGYTPEDFAGSLNLLDTVTPHDRGRALENTQRIMNRENIGSNEYTMQRKDGTIFPAMIRSTAIIQDGKPVGLRGFAIDITESKEAEEKLRESEAKFRTIFESANDAIFLMDPNLIIAYNPKALEMFGCTREQIIGYPTHQLSPEVQPDGRKSLEKAQEKIRAALRGPAQFFEWEHKRCDGTLFNAEVSLNVFCAEGKHYLQAIIRDITDRKRAEEEKQSLQERLQRAEKMESLGLLAGGVAHDLNNVLGIVVGYAELILESVDAASSIKPHLVNIMKGGQKAAAIVDDLLTLARRGVSGKEVRNLNEIIADCQQSPEFEKLYSYHPAVKINSDLEPDQPNITCSSVHLGKSFYNLVSNACEAMPKGGMVTIKTTSQYLEQPLQGYDEVRGGEYVVLSVSDTGEGISAADLKRIFEPFYTKKVMGRSGTGLGLAVVWGTVKDHHGYINVQSEKGKGSTFTLYFPVTREDITAEGGAASISEYMGEGESILVVDDVKEQRDLAASILKALNYNVASVASGEEAVAYLKNHEVDIMVLDMIMDPGMDGLDTYRSVLEIRPKQKAIIVSGFAESDRVHEAQGLGAGAYVKKPYIKEKLGMVVREELDRSA